MKFKNLTPHEIVVRDESGAEVLRIAPSGQIARVTQTRELVGHLAGVPVYTSAFGEVVGLPEPDGETALIVSALVRLAVPTRIDVYSPGTLVRDDKGQPIGCLGLEGVL